MSRHVRFILAILAVLLLLAAFFLFIYSLGPTPVDSLQATVVPTLMTPPQVRP